MAVKKSRTGKKKRPEYGPQGTKTTAAAVQTVSEEDLKHYKNARRANFTSIALLIFSMILLIVAPNMPGNGAANLFAIIVAYSLTIIAGGLILYTKKYVVANRTKMTTITGWLMVGVGVFGLMMTLYSVIGA